MAKRSSLYVCQQCGTSFSKWSGKCDNCGAWNSLVEEAKQVEKKAVVDRSQGKVLSVEKIAAVQAGMIGTRMGTGLGQLEEVLGDGLMPGGVVLLAGQPGIGKSY